MTVVQFSILRNLARHGALPLMRLADLLVMERTTLYRALAPLERRRWLSASEANGRAKTAVLTDQGHRALATATAAWEGAQQQFLEEIGAADWHEIEGSLGRVIAAAQRSAS